MEPWLIEIDPPVLYDPNDNNKWINQADQDEDEGVNSRASQPYRRSIGHHPSQLNSQVQQGPLGLDVSRKHHLGKQKVVASDETTTSGSTIPIDENICPNKVQDTQHYPSSLFSRECNSSSFIC